MAIIDVNQIDYALYGTRVAQWQEYALVELEGEAAAGFTPLKSPISGAQTAQQVHKVLLSDAGSNFYDLFRIQAREM